MYVHYITSTINNIINEVLAMGRKAWPKCSKLWLTSQPLGHRGATSERVVGSTLP